MVNIKKQYEENKQGIWQYKQHNTENTMICYDLLDSELGGGKMHGAPTSSLGPVPLPLSPPRLRRLRDRDNAGTV